MQFNYKKIMRLSGFTDQNIQYYIRMTGYGRLYSNYQLASRYVSSNDYLNIVIPINQYNVILFDKTCNTINSPLVQLYVGIIIFDDMHFLGIRRVIIQNKLKTIRFRHKDEEGI